MQSSSEQPFVGEEHCVTTLITAAKETIIMGVKTSFSDFFVVATPFFEIFY